MLPDLHRSAEADIPALHRIRLSVRENRLTDPNRLSEIDYRQFVTDRGETWHAEADGRIVGFGTLDHAEQSIWALFIDPDFEGTGLGKLLLCKLIEQAQLQQMSAVTLVTMPGTRAEAFYLRNGWQLVGLTSTGEIRLALSLA